jgi:hypothetical protein
MLAPMRGTRDFTLGYSTASIPIVGLIQHLLLILLLWISITVETFLRKDFGERYYTPSNVFFGLIFLLWLQLWTVLGGDFGWFKIKFFDHSLFLTISIYAYLIFSAFHLWKIWVNAHIGKPQHSGYGGNSRLEPIGRLALKYLNPLLSKLALLSGRYMLKDEDYRKLEQSLELADPVTDVRNFTIEWVEPIFLFIVAHYFTYGIVSLWLWAAGFAVLLFGRLARTNNRADQLDITDNMIVATIKKREMEDQRQRAFQLEQTFETLKEKAKANPDFIDNLKQDSPDILDALADLDLDLNSTNKQHTPGA